MQTMTTVIPVTPSLRPTVPLRLVKEVRAGRVTGWLLLIACALGGVGCKDPEQQACREAEQAVARHLPQFLNLTNREVTEVRLLGEGYSQPVWNIQGHHYLWASRQAVIGASSYEIRIYAMNPRAVGRSREAGVVITNQPAETGLKSVGTLKFMHQSPPTGEIRVYVAHAGLRYEE